MSKYLVYEPVFPMAKEILKYLIPFRKLKKCGYPGFDECNSMKDWNKALDRMIFAFKAIVKDSPAYHLKNQNEIEEGMRLFGKYFAHLWD